MDEQQVAKWSPFHLGDHKERTIILISAVIGIIAFIFILRKQSAVADSTGTYSIGSDTGTTATDLTGTPTNLGTSYGVAGTSLTDLQNMIDSSIAGITNAFSNQVDFDYTTANSTEYNQQVGAGGGGNTGGFGISGFGITIGGLGSTRAITPSNNLDIKATDQMSATTQLINTGPETLASIQNFFKEVGGTADQHMQNQANVIAMGEQSTVGIKSGDAIMPIYTKQAS
jgi:hypothetical protein